MQALINQLQARHPGLRFTASKQFFWSPQTHEVFYNAEAQGDMAQWSLLHETGHALLEHTTYQADVELLRLEVDAWEEARSLAKEFDIEIDEDHIQDCLDTYRDWLYRRSICPNCRTKCLQEDNRAAYRCFNCHTTWQVSGSRFSRSYRRTVAGEPLPSAVFI